MVAINFLLWQVLVEESHRMVFLKRLLKVMSVTAVLVVALVLFSYSFQGKRSVEDLRIPVSDLALDHFKQIVWNDKPVILLRRANPDRESDHSSLLIVYAYSPDFGCPIEVLPVSPKSPARFKAVCSSTLYDDEGRLLPGQSARFDLEKPLYRMAENGDVIFGEE
jgi:hypothetical protein